MKISIARRNLFRQRTRLAISAGGVGAAVMLILLILGLHSAWRENAASYLRAVEADVWVAQSAAPGDLYHGISILPLALGDALEDVEGVRSAQPFVGRQILFHIGDRHTHFYLVGLDLDRPWAAPPEAEGRRVPASGEIVVDSVFARMEGIAIGDELHIADERLRVTGLSGRTNAILANFAFVDMPTAIRILQADVEQFAPELADATQQLANYFLLQVDGDPAEVVTRINDRAPHLRAMTRTDFVEANLAELEEGILPILWALVLIALAVGTAVVALTIYTATLERTKEYGVLKALGFSNRRLYRVVAEQSLIATVIGFSTGIVLAFAASGALRWWLPMFAVRLTWVEYLVVGGLVLVMAVVAAILPARPVARIDPAEVFRA